MGFNSGFKGLIYSDYETPYKFLCTPTSVTSPLQSSSFNPSPAYYVVMYVMVLYTSVVNSCCISIFGFIYFSAKFVSCNNQIVVYLITVSRHSSTYPCYFNDDNFGYAKA